ncbi:hypothetical protein AGLY_012297 [Aphis glycines]|uniref:Transposable element P transposase-like RNase H C-terminal domain-containing protein n=1 Tax=Aphis glycines TaxID=307491 RepID=A0A6G0TAL1_APHGL|nr:hypothetical protein AGLY_012297 [Aphis glycines]
MRSRDGFNNNPNAIQFRSAYKRLLVRHKINSSAFGNCTLLDSSTILYVSANKRNDADAIFNFDNNDESQYFDEFDHDYEYQRPALEDFVVDVVKYTNGFIVRKIKRQKNIYIICESQLVDENNESIPLLLKIKNKGRLINTSADVQKICLATEHVIRMNNHLLLTKKNISQYLCIKSMNGVCFETSIFNSDIMKNHIMDQDVFNIFLKPKKDLCDVCEKFKLATPEEKVLLKTSNEEHLKSKSIARDKKNIDKMRANNDPEVCVAVFDLQKVLITPKREMYTMEQGTSFFLKSLLPMKKVVSIDSINFFLLLIAIEEGLKKMRMEMIADETKIAQRELGTLDPPRKKPKYVKMQEKLKLLCLEYINDEKELDIFLIIFDLKECLLVLDDEYQILTPF